VVGALVLAVGLGLTIYSVVDWGRKDFGALDARHAIRLAVPAATALVLGFEAILASFFLSVLGLARR
jgi:hypothetical protein